MSSPRQEQVAGVALLHAHPHQYSSSGHGEISVDIDCSDTDTHWPSSAHYHSGEFREDDSRDGDHEEFHSRWS